MKLQPLGHTQVQWESKTELDETVELRPGSQIQNNALSPLLFSSGLNPLSQILMIVDPLQMVRDVNLMEQEQGQSNRHLPSPVSSPKTLMVNKLAKGGDRDQEAHAQGVPCPATLGWTSGDQMEAQYWRDVDRWRRSQTINYPSSSAFVGLLATEYAVLRHDTRPGLKCTTSHHLSENSKERPNE